MSKIKVACFFLDTVYIILHICNLHWQVNPYQSCLIFCTLFLMCGCRHCWTWLSALVMQSREVWRGRTLIACRATASTPSYDGRRHSKAAAIYRASCHFRRRVLCASATLSHDSCSALFLANMNFMHAVWTNGWRYRLFVCCLVWNTRSIQLCLPAAVLKTCCSCCFIMICPVYLFICLFT